MPKKKAKKSKKKVKSSKTGDETGDLDIEGDGAQLGISKKKKGKKAKLTKEEKAAAKLAKQLESFINNEKLYNVFLQKTDTWMIANHVQVETLFKRFDADEDGIVPLQIFQAGLRDLQCPLNEIEIQALCKKLDPEDTGLIEYFGFERGIHDRIIEEEEEANKSMSPEDYLPELYLTKPATASGLNDPFHQDHPRYVKLNMRMATFENVVKHPGHFSVTVRTNMPISILVEVIVENSRISSGEIQVYSDKSCQAMFRLPNHLTLDQCGVRAGPFRNPPSVTLYYDYMIEFSDCPLLNCDHYFGIEKRPLNPVLAAFPGLRKKKGKLPFAEL